MHKITFHNLGNADCISLTLSNKRRILFDYADSRDPSNSDDRRCCLPKALREDLGKQCSYDVVAFTHLDQDHYQGATKFFYFDHIKRYQEDVDGKPRIKMRVLWIPAAVITEDLGLDANEEAKDIQKEARERFKAGSGVRVFSRPERLRYWCEDNGIDLDARLDLLTDAGELAPEFSESDDEAEFFVHSPFAMRQDDQTIEDRNDDSLVMHVTLKYGTKVSGLLLTSDVSDVVLSEIVQVTEHNKNNSRLEWDILKAPHHCSYKSLNSEEKGVDKTNPTTDVKRLFEDYSRKNCVVVSSSDTIPRKGDDRDTQKNPNPPHRQAANYYKEDVVASSLNYFLVTMEQPSISNPKPISIVVDEYVTIKKAAAGLVPAVNTRSPRAG